MPVRVEDIAVVIEPLVPEASLAEAVRRFAQDRSLRALPVVFEGTPIGLVLSDDLLELIFQQANQPDIMSLPVTRRMERQFSTTERGAPVAYLAQASLQADNQALRHGAILVDENRYIGFITPEAISQSVTKENTARAKALRTAQTHIAEARNALVTQRAEHIEFLAILAHELRTPLTGILGVADLLCDARLKGDNRDYARTISQSGRFLERLLNDLLDLSRIESGKLRIENEPVDLRGFAREAKQLWTSQIDSDQVQLKFSLGEDLPDRIDVDPVRLRQILFNLIGNAVKFTEAGQIRVTLSTASTSKGQLALNMEVADTGSGIADSDKARLFEAWEQSHTSDARIHGGAGLGLSVARGLAVEMGGHIELSDNPGGGSIFRVSCPARISGPVLALDNETPQGKIRDLTLGRILVAEDHAANRLVLDRALSAAGWRVDMVHTGEQALRRARKQAYQAILLDIHLPTMSGDEVTRRIREETGPNRDVPFVSLSADMSAKQRGASEAAGFDAFIEKPIHPRELVAKLVDTILDAPQNRDFSKRLQAIAG